MNIKQKWELICRYVSLKEEASSRKVRFSKTKELYQRSLTFGNLLDSMEEILEGKELNISLFDGAKKNTGGIKIKELPFPKTIDKIILFDEYKDYSLLKDIEPSKVPFLFVKGTTENFNELLQTNSDSAISIVGSRETPEIYEKWIDERIPKEKIIVSGLANGADLIGHRVAMKKNLKIIVFPGYEITKNPSKKKMDVWNYALKEGLIMSSVIPGIRTHIQSDLIKRNYEMAKVVSATYALYFGLTSGTMNHLEAIAADNKKIFVPINIYNNVLPSLKDTLVGNNMEVK